MRAVSVLRISAFLVALAWPLLTLGRDDGKLHEQRTLAPMPSLAAGDRYPEEFDAWFRDHFGSRDRLIRWHNLLEFHLLGQAPVDRVIVGSSGWFFYSNPRDGMDIRNFAGRWPHTAADIEAWLTRQDAKEQEYARHGARYLIAIAPDKQSVYPELVPYRYGPHAPGVLDELLAHVRSHPRLRVLDLRPALRAHADPPLYFKADSHWNARGAFLAAQAITEALRPDFPNVGVIRKEDYVLSATPTSGGDLADMIALGVDTHDESFKYERRTPGGRVFLDLPGNTIWKHADTRLPTAVLFGDSYGVALEWVLCDAFSRLHYDMTTSNGPDPGIVARDRPDVVVLILVERNLPKLMDQ